MKEVQTRMLFSANKCEFDPVGQIYIKPCKKFGQLKIIANGNSDKLEEYLSRKRKNAISDTECSLPHKSYNLYVYESTNVKIESQDELVPAQNEDLKEIAELFSLMYLKTQNKALPFSYAEEFARGNLNRIYLIKNGNSVCSMVRIAAICDDYTRINTIVVSKDHLGQGYAKRAVRAICSKIAKNGGKITILADAENPVTNHIYSSLGFEKKGKLYEYVFDDEICENALISTAFDN